MRSLLTPTGNDLWDPFSWVRDMRQEMEKVFERSLIPSRISGKAETFFAPDVDVKDEKDQIVVKADIPGIKKEDLTVSVEGDLLTLKGERKESQEKKEKDYYHCERFYGAFSRTLELPAKVKTDNVKATYRDGVLEVTLLKDENSKPKEVKVQIQ